MKNWVTKFKKKGFLLVLLVITVFVIDSITSDNQYAGMKVVVGQDTCTVQYKHSFTGNFRLQGKDGRVFSAKPSELLIIAQN